MASSNAVSFQEEDVIMDSDSEDGSNVSDNEEFISDVICCDGHDPPLRRDVDLLLTM
jgi:hypothetical protein